MDYSKIILFFFFILVAGGITLLNSGSPSEEFPAKATNRCRGPLTYRFGDIDSRFNITETTLKEVMEDVATLWSKPIDKKLVSYNPNGDVSIHFVYSEEQQFTENEKQLSNRIAQERKRFESLKENYEKLASRYQEELNAFNTKLDVYHRDLDRFNSNVSELNAKGGIPKSEQSKFEKQKEELQERKRGLDQERRELKALVEKVNRLSDQLNNIADQQNTLVYHYNERYSEQEEFNQGNYLQAGQERKINIYQFDDIDNLRLVLAHEVGHALGLSHVSNPLSVMYYLMDQQDVSNLQLSQEDIEALRDVCGD